MQWSEPQQQSQAQTRLPKPPATGVHICPDCESKFVQPLEWERAGERRWAVTLWCPNCHWGAEGTYDQAIMERFDEELDEGAEELVASYQRVVRANLADEADRFAAALAANALLPADF